MIFFQSNTLQSMRPKNTSLPVFQSPSFAYPVGVKFHSMSPSSSWISETEPTLETRCRNIKVACALPQTVSVVTVLVSVLAANSTTLVPLSSNITTGLSSLSTMASPISNMTTDTTGLTAISDSLYFSTYSLSLNDSSDNNSTEDYLNSTTDFYSEEYDTSDYSGENSSYQYSDSSAFFVNGTIENRLLNYSESTATETSERNENSTNESLNSLRSTMENNISSDDFPENYFTTESPDIEMDSSTNSFSPTESSTTEQLCINRVCDEIPMEGQNPTFPSLTTKSTDLPTLTGSLPILFHSLFKNTIKRIIIVIGFLFCQMLYYLYII